MVRTCLLAALSILTAAANAEVPLCKELIPPTTITEPGLYCMSNDYQLNLASGAAINIRANNVVINMNGHRISNLAAGPSTTADGISTYRAPGVGQQSVTVRNGTIRGFNRGIFLFMQDQPAGFVVEDMLIDKSVWAGITVVGNNSTIRRNRIVGTGGTRPESEDSARGSYGIYVAGRNTNVVENEITETTSPNYATGISVESALGSPATSIVTGNRIIHLQARNGYNEVGIKVDENALVSNNQIQDSESPTGGGTTIGIDARSTTVKVVNNTVNVERGAPYSGGNQVSNTNH